jgi:hypothetical protein
MQKLARIAFTLIFLVIATPIHSDSFGVSHYCSKPHKPYEFNDEWELERFKDDVEEYKRCINDFVEEQHDAIRNHQRAAEEAIDEWNNFVDYELN